jgi:hypothetical protein
MKGEMGLPSGMVGERIMFYTYLFCRRLLLNSRPTNGIAGNDSIGRFREHTMDLISIFIYKNPPSPRT